MFSDVLWALLLAGLPAVMGIALAVGLCFFRQWRPTPLPWPIFVFFLLLGLAAANIDGVCFGGADALISSGGFLGDEFDVQIHGAILLFFALPGLLVSLFTLRTKDSRPPHSGSAWAWSWLLSQSLLDTVVFMMGISHSFRPFPDSADGLPLLGYLIIMGTLTVTLGFLFGYRWGRTHSVLAPLLGWLWLSVTTVVLLTLMYLDPGGVDPTWGLSLIQCPAGSWYALLFSPSAVLLGDYQYCWEITKWSLLASGLVPHLLFTLGYLTPKLFRKRGTP